MEDLDVDVRIMILRKYGVRLWTGFSWLWVGTHGELLYNTVMNLKVP